MLVTVVEGEQKTPFSIATTPRRKWERYSFRPPLYFGVAAIEKGAFESPSTIVANFTYLHKMLSFFFSFSLFLLFEFKLNQVVSANRQIF